ncbi:M66 family metalloprotease [Candidatus Palauibacter sp.]|uniref:M66 family metalloprotease n=1 Tax=Candidatus Palauibacter sp. TaxID=3101350 RepID=UPI003B524486
MTSLKDLLLPRNDFSGTIPPELGSLANLEVLWLFLNDLTGEIPAQLGNLTRLEVLSIGDNPLSGRIPPELGGLPALRDLDLGRTNLSGPIPPELGQLPSLTFLGLCANNLSGPVPAELGDIRTLERLSLCHNPELSGLLPRSLMNLEFLSEFLFYGTKTCAQIDGQFQEWLVEVGAEGDECDPAEVERRALGEFFTNTGGDAWATSTEWNSDAPLNDWHGVTTTDGRVHELALPANGLRGPLAPEIGNLTELRVLNLADNSLSGGFPIVISSMAELDTLSVSGNREMEGRLPFQLTELEGLEALTFANTGMCASPAETFQRWLGGLSVVDGATCGNPESVTLTMPVVYLTQAIQRPEGDVPLIAGRDALLRVFLTADESQAFFEPEVVATFSRGGREVHRVVMRRDGDLLATFADEGHLRNSYNAVIPGTHIVPGTELVVQADPAGTVPLAPGSQPRFPASGARPLNVIYAPPMELTVVPVVEAEEPDLSIYEWTDNIGDDSPEVGLLRYAFPFFEFRARTRETYVTSLDLTTESGQWRLRLELVAVRAAENGRGYWYGAASSVNGTVRGLASFGDWVSIGKAWDTELAHEVGHSLDLRHAPCGGALYSDPEFPYANGSIGVWGYDFRDGNLVPPDRRRDIMGYCYEQGWLSDYYYEKVIDYRAQADAQTARAVAGAGQRSEMVVLWGGVVDGELRIEPPFRMTTTARLPEGAGPYRLEGTRDDGQVELSLAFTPGEDKFGNKYFFFTVPIEADWAESLDRLTLTGPEGTVTVNAADERSLSIVSDPATGRIRSILRDWEDVLPATLGRTHSFTVTTVQGLDQAVRLKP